jgi:hypothetical protein
MIFSSLEINKIWSNRTAVLDKVYICEDKCLYKGLKDGTLIRLSLNDPDAYIKEIRKQEAELAANEYNQQDQIRISTTKQVEVDFNNSAFEKEFVIKDNDVSPSHKILAELAYEAPTGKDVDELQMDDLIVKAGAGDREVRLFITAADGSPLEGKFKINYKIN